MIKGHKHSWIPVLYNEANEEVGWICEYCGMRAQSSPEKINMEERNDNL